MKAIEDAMNSPLLNDNDIKGAKWILININSAPGEHEFTMDEVEVIQNYLLTQAGEGTDVILGMGYDTTLEDRLGITLIATGFEHKDPFAKPVVKKPEPKPEEKIVMVLKTEEPKPVLMKVKLPDAAIEKEVEVMEEALQEPAPVEAVAAPIVEENNTDYLMPTLVEELPVQAPIIDLTDMREEEEEEPAILHYTLQPVMPEIPAVEKLPGKSTIEDASNSTVNKNASIVKNESIISTPLPATVRETDAELILSIKDNAGTTPVSAAAGGYLARPSNIYADSKAEVDTSKNSVEKPVSIKPVSNEEEELLDLQMQIIERDDIPAADMPLAHQAQSHLTTEVEDPAMQDETEEQKRRAAERLHKLRNLSFNVNAADPNNEFETVPAYIRRNMELYNNSTQIEKFYSHYEVKSDQNNQGQISTINTFLDGDKAD